MEDLSELTPEEQVTLLQAQPEGGQTDNSPSADIEQPPQDKDWMPNPTDLVKDA